MRLNQNHKIKVNQKQEDLDHLVGHQKVTVMIAIIDKEENVEDMTVVMNQVMMIKARSNNKTKE